MRLRTLTEAECYARCYGGRHEEAVNFVRVLSSAERRYEPIVGERLKDLYAEQPPGGRGREAA